MQPHQSGPEKFGAQTGRGRCGWLVKLAEKADQKGGDAAFFSPLKSMFSPHKKVEAVLRMVTRAAKADDTLPS